MHHRLPLAVLATALGLGGGAAHAQQEMNIVKFGAVKYTTNSKSNGIQGIGVPPGADAETGDAWTLLLGYERMLTPNLSIDLVLGIPPKIKARATGSVAFLGDDVLSAKNVSPTVLLAYRFGAPGDTFRPYVGAGVNYTRFVSIESKLADRIEMSDSTGWALKLGVEYNFSKPWAAFASVAAEQVKTTLVGTGTTVLTTEIDLRPVTYSFGLAYRF